MKPETQNREKLAKKVADARHMSKPDADNATVVRTGDGRWLFEIYTVGHSVGAPEPRQTARGERNAQGHRQAGR